MSVGKRNIHFYTSEEGLEAQEELRSMQADPGYNTEGTYCADGSTYTDHVMPFVVKHMKYLSEHKDLNPQHYLSNLRLMTRIRTQ